MKMFFQKYFVIYKRLAVKNLFGTDVWSKLDYYFCEFLYVVNYWNLIK